MMIKRIFFSGTIVASLFSACVGNSALLPGSQQISAPIYNSSYSLGGDWLYLEQSSNRGDLEYATLLTLTEDPDNLTAHMQQLTPSYRNGYKVNLEYTIPWTNCSFKVNYSNFSSKDAENIDTLDSNQFFQNFLGGSFLTAGASEWQKTHQVDLQMGSTWIVDHCFSVTPYVGVSYGNLRRQLYVNYKGYNDDFALPPLTGLENSCYWGVGPMAGFSFSSPLTRCWNLEGFFRGGSFFGEMKSSLSSYFSREEIAEHFNEKYDYTRAVPFINGAIGLSYAMDCFNGCFGCKLSFGYETDYYFNAVDRITPYNGYVNNPESYPIRRSNHLGESGPYVHLSIFNNPFPIKEKTVCECPSLCNYSGIFIGSTSSWLQPSASDKDLTYAVLERSGNSDEDIRVKPPLEWAGSYYVGYHHPSNFDMIGKYFHYGVTDRDSIIAAAGQEIRSLNSSGPEEVRFQRANSKVEYCIDQVDLIVAKNITPCRSLSLQPSVGLRYSDLERIEKNSYLEGIPALTTENKYAKLQSSMRGVGPMFGLNSEFSYCNKIGIVASADISLLVGGIESKLDQTNEGIEGISSNTLRFPNVHQITPVVDLNAGAYWTFSFCKLFQVKIEAGYQFSEYYRGVNQVRPELLTGLEQNNSNLRLSGPYVSLEIFGY